MMKTQVLLLSALVAFGVANHAQEARAQTLPGKIVYSYNSQLYLRTTLSTLDPLPAGHPSDTLLTSGGHPRLSPDGSKLAFGRGSGSAKGRWVMELQTLQETRVASSAGWPTWSDDGTWLAFGGIQAVTANGASLTTLSSQGSFPAWSPSIALDPNDPNSPRLAKIAFVSTSGTKPQRKRIWWMEVTYTPTAIQVTQAPALLADLGSDNPMDLDWQPSGLLAFNKRTASTHTDVFTIDPLAADPLSTLTQITASPDLDIEPRWSPLNPATGAPDYIAFRRVPPLKSESVGGAFVINLNDPNLQAFLVIPSAFHIDH